MPPEPSLKTQAMRLFQQNRLHEAREIFIQAASQNPSDISARSAIMQLSFLLEDWQHVWEIYEWRLQFSGQSPAGEFARKRWHKGDVPKHLIVIGEQGFGDTLHFCRFLPELVQKAEKVTFLSHQKLHHLLKTLSHPPHLQPMTETLNLGAESFWVPLMSLPRALGRTTPETFIPEMPYLQADQNTITQWREKLGTQGIKIGIAWQGSANPMADAGRSMPLALFEPLSRIKDVRLISLQKGFGEEQIPSCPFKIETLGQDFDAGQDAFKDTAAIMMSLDLIITVDTSLGHLAGALNRPTYILLKHTNADWRWLHQHTDTPWYLKTKLFRQKKQGHWEEPIQQIIQEIHQSDHFL